MSEASEYHRNRRSPGRVTHPATERKQYTVDVLSGKAMGQRVNLRPSHQGESPCSGCENFEDHGRFLGTCSKVAGSIQLTDTCDSYTPSQGLTPSVDTAQDGG